jgi:arsenate reductase
VTTTIYGIKNCETMKKARAWLDGRGIAYAFVDGKLTVGFAAEVYERALRCPPHA